MTHPPRRARLPRLAAVACVVAFVACASPPTGSPAPNEPAAAIAEPTSAPPSNTPKIQAISAEERRAQAEIRRVLRQVSRMRKLPALGPVAGNVIDRPTMLAQVKQQVREQVPPEAIEGESSFLAAFDLIPEDYDYEAGVYRLIESQLAGYYDPDRKTMFLMADLSRAESEVTLAHELVHALQDQHYSLGPRLKFQKDANDAQAAVHCLAEGDATSLMLDFTLQSAGIPAYEIPDDRLRLEIVSGMALSPEMASFPRVLRDSLVAPYVDGVLFVHALRRRGGWSAVDAVWRNPPVSTEQVLHVDKLLAREAPESVDVPVAPSGAAWETIHSDVYGEQGLRIALEEWMPRRVAARAAEGWAGDRVAVLRRSDHDVNVTVAAWHVRFDRSTNDEAKEAFEAIAASWGKTGTTGICHALDNGRHVLLAKKGRDIALVAGSSPSVANDRRVAATCTQLDRWASAIVAQ